MYLKYLVVCLLLSSPAQAAMHGSGGGGGGGGICASDPSHATDGCDSADPNSTFLQTNFLTYAAQSGQTLAYFPCAAGQPTCWFLAGASDIAHGQGGYPVGYHTPLASLNDPTVASLPTGCKYYSGGHGWYLGFGPMVDCAAVVSPTVSGFNFGPTATHGCIQLTFESNVTGTINVTNNNFEAAPASSGFGAGQNCASAGTSVPSGVGFIGLINFYSGTKANVNLTYNSFNGHWLDSCCNAIFNATVSRGVGLVPIYYMGNGATQGLVTMDYCSMIGFNGAGPTIANANPAASPGGFIMKHSYQEGVQARTPYGHIDGIYFSPGTATFPTLHYETYYNTVLQPSVVVATGTSWQFHSTNGSGYTVNVVQDHNFLVLGNFVTGASTYNVTAGGTVDNGAGAAGNIFTLTSGGPVYTGSSPAAGNFALADQINSTQWHIDCTINGVAPCTAPNKGNFAATVSVGPFTVSSQSWYNHWSNYPAFGHTHGGITNLTITNNYIDSFIDDPGGASPFNVASPCSNPATVTGNVDMRTGANLPIAGGGAGC
jgi:hypothetical protein